MISWIQDLVTVPAHEFSGDFVTDCSGGGRPRVSSRIGSRGGRSWREDEEVVWGVLGTRGEGLCPLDECESGKECLLLSVAVCRA